MFHFSWDIINVHQANVRTVEIILSYFKYFIMMKFDYHINLKPVQVKYFFSNLQILIYNNITNLQTNNLDYIINKYKIG